MYVCVWCVIDVSKHWLPKFCSLRPKELYFNFEKQFLIIWDLVDFYLGFTTLATVI